MALTGLQIYKLLPKTNCKECGFPTCLAFAMQLAQKKVELDKCPYVSDEAKETLVGAAAPPVKLVTVGVDPNKFCVGEETVLFRHEQKFYNPCGIAIAVSDSEDVAEAAEKVNSLHWTRIGMEISVDLIALTNDSGDATKFKDAAVKLSEASQFPLILRSSSVDALKAAANAIEDKRPLLYGADASNYEELGAFCAEKKLPLAVAADSLDSFAELTPKIGEMGVDEMVLVVPEGSIRDRLEFLTNVRRAAIKKTFRPLGFPTILDVSGEDAYEKVTVASVGIAKYAGILVVDIAELWQIMPLLTLRQNIYTDPQKPIQVEPKVYEVGSPDERSPVMFTTNFSLTYFAVEGEVEASRVPAYILSVDTEGLSVLTAYSGDKLTPEGVAKALEESGIAGRVSHKKLIIPGYVAVMSGKLEEKTGWEILVGPREAAFLPKYLKETWK